MLLEIVCTNGTALLAGMTKIDLPFTACRASNGGPGAMKRGIALYCLICAVTYARSTAEVRAALPCASADRAPAGTAMIAIDTARDTRDSRRVRRAFTIVLLCEPSQWSAAGTTRLN